MRDQYVKVGKVRTRYRSAGKSGMPLVLLHGLGSSLEAWSQNMEGLGRHFRVFAPDMVWFGKTDKPNHEPTMEYFGEFIAGFMDAVGARRAVLIGNSMGGMLAAKTALLYPRRIAGLVLVNSAGFGRELGWWLRLRGLLPVGKERRPPHWAVQFALSQLFHDPGAVSDEIIEATIEMALQPGGAESYKKVLRSGVDWRGMRDGVLADIRDAADRIQCPTLIIWGREDRVIPVRHAHIAHARIPNSRLYIFEQCGHAPMIERAEEFIGLVTNFIREKVERPAPWALANVPWLWNVMRKRG